MDLFENRVPPGVDEAAYVKASWLTAVLEGTVSSPLVSKRKAVDILGTMQGGYNIAPLIKALDVDDLAEGAADELSKTLLMFDAFHDVEAKARAGNTHAERVMRSWAEAEWFTSRPEVPEKITFTTFKVTGETNTDDLSPAPDAWSRPDIPLHALAMLKNPREGITDAPAQIEALKQKGHQIAYVGDVVGTGSSRKSATNSVLWFMGDDIPNVPNKRTGGLCVGGKIAPIFFNTMEDSGALPIEMDVSNMHMGDVVDVFPYQGVAKRHGTEEVIATFALKTEVLLDEVRAGGRINLIIGRGLTTRARESLGLPQSDVFRLPQNPPGEMPKGFTLAQNMVGKACGVEAHPARDVLRAQDDHGWVAGHHRPMTRDELKDLACLGFSSDLVMQSFCHTAAYPKPVDVVTHHTLPDFIRTRGGVSLRPGDGVIHSWLNRMLLPDTVGTGGDSHTRFPIGISFPAGSGLVAFGAATGVIPLDMPESVRVRFSGTMQPGITLRDLVHAIPYYAIKEGHLTVDKQGKKNVFSGRILEIEGLEHLKCEQAFELSDASAERSARVHRAGRGAHSRVPREQHRDAQVDDRRRLRRPEDDRASYRGHGGVLAEPEAQPTRTRCFATIDINMDDIKEPVLCAPNDPGDALVVGGDGRQGG